MIRQKYGKPEMDDKLTEAEADAYARMTPDEQAAIDAMAERIAASVPKLGTIGAREILCRLGMWLVLEEER